MRKLYLLLVALFIISICAALADDVQFPPWDRGGERTTYQRWEFYTDNSSPSADELLNPYGSPLVTLSGATWSQLLDNHVGVWSVPNSMSIRIPNAPDHKDWTKALWVQLTWEYAPTAAPIVRVDGVVGTLVNEVPVSTPAGQTWLHSTYMIALPYNPEFETVEVVGTFNLDELVIDTICTYDPVPEPSGVVSMACGLGGLAALVLRRRK